MDMEILMPHIDTGSYVFYIHPHWHENWEGQIKFTKAVEEEYRNGIFAKPNRFIWIQDNIYHDVTTTSPSATHSRVDKFRFSRRTSLRRSGWYRIHKYNYGDVIQSEEEQI